MALRRTVYVKIPSNRAGFIDPVNVKWSEEREQKLWKVLSHSKRNELDCKYLQNALLVSILLTLLGAALSEQFSVPVSFLQQQAYWLYENELEQLRNEMQRAQTADTITESTRELSSQKSDSHANEKTIDNLSASTKNFNVFEQRALKRVPKYSHIGLNNADPDATVRQLSFEEDSSSDSNSSSSSLNNLNQESVFLHKSRIHAKAPPAFDDSDDEEEVEYQQTPVKGYESITFNDDSQNSKTSKTKTTTESSLSNLSSFSVSKSALEEALLDNSRF